jgi:hypothetical protein
MTASVIDIGPVEYIYILMQTLRMTLLCININCTNY